MNFLNNMNRGLLIGIVSVLAITLLIGSFLLGRSSIEEPKGKDYFKDKAVISDLLKNALGNKTVDDKLKFFDKSLTKNTITKDVYNKYFNFNDIGVIEYWINDTNKDFKINEISRYYSPINDNLENNDYIVDLTVSHESAPEIRDGNGGNNNKMILEKKYILKVSMDDYKVKSMETISDSKYIMYDEMGKIISESIK